MQKAAYKVNSEILKAAKASLKVLQPDEPTEDANEHSYALADPPSPALEVSVLAAEGESMEGNTSSGGSQICQAKKAKLTEAVGSRRFTPFKLS